MSTAYCWECKYIHFDPGSPDYSDVTPGWDMELRCEKDKWNATSFRDNESLGGALLKANSCVNFERAK